MLQNQIIKRPGEQGMKETLEKTLNQFRSIALEDLDSVALLNRMDTKYVFNSGLLTALLEGLEQEYYALEIDSRRCFRYETLYYDTPQSDMFLSHIRGKLNRFKVRERLYADTGDSFLEVKFKNNKKRTVKWRSMEHVNLSYNDESHAFLAEYIPYSPDKLTPMLNSHFNRLTLVDNAFTHRVTIDFDIRFRQHASGDKKYHSLPHLAIIEIKTSKGAEKNGIHQKLRELGIQPYGFSKYCIGRALIDPDFEKLNLLKPKLLYLNKIANANIYNCG